MTRSSAIPTAIQIAVRRIVRRRFPESAIAAISMRTSRIGSQVATLSRTSTAPWTFVRSSDLKSTNSLLAFPDCWRRRRPRARTAWPARFGRSDPSWIVTSPFFVVTRPPSLPVRTLTTSPWALRFADSQRLWNLSDSRILSAPRARTARSPASRTVRRTPPSAAARRPPSSRGRCSRSAGAGSCPRALPGCRRPWRAARRCRRTGPCPGACCGSRRRAAIWAPGCTRGRRARRT